MDCNSTSAAERVWESAADVQCPKDRNPIFFMGRKLSGTRPRLHDGDHLRPYLTYRRCKVSLTQTGEPDMARRTAAKRPSVDEYLQLFAAPPPPSGALINAI